MASSNAMQEPRSAVVAPTRFTEIRNHCRTIAGLLETSRKSGARDLSNEVRLLVAAADPPHEALSLLPPPNMVLERLHTVEAAVRYWTDKGVAARLQRVWDRLWQKTTPHNLHLCCGHVQGILSLIQPNGTGEPSTDPIVPGQSTSLHPEPGHFPPPKNPLAATAVLLPSSSLPPIELDNSLSKPAMILTESQLANVTELGRVSSPANATCLVVGTLSSVANADQSYGPDLMSTSSNLDSSKPQATPPQLSSETCGPPSPNSPTTESPPEIAGDGATPGLSNITNSHSIAPQTSGSPAERRLSDDAQSNNTPALPQGSSFEATPNQGRNTMLDSNSRRLRSSILARAKLFLKTMSNSAPVIPVAGTILKAVADVGVTVVEMLDGFENNEEDAEKLGAYISSLVQAIVQYFSRPDESQKDPSDVDQLPNDLADALHAFYETLIKTSTSLEALEMRQTLPVLTLYEMNKAELGKMRRDIECAFKELQIRLDLMMLRSLRALATSNLEWEKRSLLDRLGGADNGVQDKAASPKELVCMPGTRLGVLETIYAWLGDSSRSMFWLSGVAGCGKTAIAATVYEKQVVNSTTKAIFYCTAGDQQRCETIVCSLAFWLAHPSRGSLEKPILEAIRAEPNIANLVLSKQVEALLDAPLRSIASDAPPAVIVIDALDEWYSPGKVSTLIKLLIKLQSSRNVKILITSRTEKHIVDALGISSVRSLALDDIDHESVDFDIDVFVKTSLSALRKQPGLELDSDWPGDIRLAALVRKSEHLFQFAATSIRYIASGYPPDTLNEVLDSQEMHGRLDYLYLSILKGQFQVGRGGSTGLVLRHVLICLVCSAVPVSLNVIAYLWCKNSRPQDEYARLRASALDHLRSFLVVPRDPDQPIRFLHTSIVDFLTDASRCTDARFYVGTIEGHAYLAQLCLQRLNRDLKENILGVDGYVYDLEENKQVEHTAKIPDGLCYASAHWADHLPDIPSPSTSEELVHQLQDFSSTHLLHWLEVLAYLGSVLSVGHPAARKASKWCQNLSEAPTLGLLFYDTYRFIGQFPGMLACYPLISYKNLIAFAPKTTSLHEKYAGTPYCVKFIRGPRQKRWPAHQWTANHGNFVQ